MCALRVCTLVPSNLWLEGGCPPLYLFLPEWKRILSEIESERKEVVKKALQELINCRGTLEQMKYLFFNASKSDYYEVEAINWDMFKVCNSRVCALNEKLEGWCHDHIIL